jgi:hypothetical protein
MSEMTVIYYTHNHEFPDFEWKIQCTIMDEKGDLPIISVSQKPISFGENICIGVQGANSLNTWRQVQIGTKAAKTRFVCLAESDILHHSSYFSFEPEKDDIFYVAKRFYILFAGRGKNRSYFLKDPSDTNLIVGRDYLLQRLDYYLEGRPQWQKESDYEHNAFPDHRLFSEIGHRVLVDFQVPTVTFKTDQGMHRKSPHHRGGVRTLPYWGDCKELYMRYFS